MAGVRRFHVLVVVVAVLGVLVAWLVTGPALQYTAARGEVASATAELVSRLDSSSSQASVKRAREVVKSIPPSPSTETAAVLAVVAREVGVSDVTVDVLPSSTASADTFAGLVPVTVGVFSVTGSASSAQLAAFFQRLGEVTPAVQVVSGDFTSGDGGQFEFVMQTLSAPLQSTVESYQ